ncbi:MAG: nucleotidyltransferase family protein, partial [Oscillospiraceae bacterium]|nr:nucleotidyltransferase family protein [Oscillospiraceae bacterium]
MKAVGIVAEYNPFHTGHAYHIAETRRLIGEDRPVVCVMSGNWVQRGECALTDKWTRAAMALNGGADLVLELPLPWAISSAEGFAQGAIAVLKATGVVGTISFGSESGRLSDLCRIAEVTKTAEFQAVLRGEMEKGISFADARQRAAIQMMGKGAKLLQGPNDSLGVEYIRVAGRDLVMMAVKRHGVSHDSPCPGKDFASASYLREKLRRGEDVSGFLQSDTSERLEKAGIAHMEHIERAVLARLRQMNKGDFALLPDSGAAEGLPARLCR